MKFANAFSPDKLKAWVDDAVSAQAGRLFLWLPVAFGAGVAVYLSLSFEPPLLAVAVPSILMIALTVSIRYLNWNSYLYGFTILLCVFCVGASVAKLRTEHVRAPVLDPSVTNYTLEAFVIDNVSPSSDAPRLLLAPISMQDLPPDKVPLRLRVSLKPRYYRSGGHRAGRRHLDLCHP